MSSLKKWKDTSLAILNIVSKVSLVIDRNIPNSVLDLLAKCIAKLKGSREYGINPIINMVEANIYTNVSGHQILF